MTLHALHKGHRGENEVSKLLNEFLVREDIDIGCKVERHLGQARDSGADIHSLPGLVIEVKRQETLGVDRWWGQVLSAAEAEGCIPVLMYRKNRQKWTVCVPAYLLYPTLPGKLSMSLETFFEWLRVYLTD